MKRIVVIAGPARSPARLRDPLAVPLGGTSSTAGRGGGVTRPPRRTQPGDKLLAVDGKSFPNLTRRRATHLSTREKHRCAAQPRPTAEGKQPVDLKIQRNGQVEHLSVTPFYDEHAPDAPRFQLRASVGRASPWRRRPRASEMARRPDLWGVQQDLRAQQRKKITASSGISDVSTGLSPLWRREALTLIRSSASLAGDHQPIPKCKAARRRAHLLSWKVAASGAVPHAVSAQRVGFQAGDGLFAIASNDITLNNGGLNIRWAQGFLISG
jgi:hypothetical protein